MWMCSSRRTHLQHELSNSEHQTVDLSSKCMTKDFLRDFRHGWTVHGGQEDHTFHMKLQVVTTMRTQKQWYLGWVTWLSWTKDVFTHMVHGIHEFCSTHIKHTNRHRPNRCFCFLVMSTQLYFHVLFFLHNGASRTRKTNLSSLVSETHCHWTLDCPTP